MGSCVENTMINVYIFMSTVCIDSSTLYSILPSLSISGGKERAFVPADQGELVRACIKGSLYIARRLFEDYCNPVVYSCIKLPSQINSSIETNGELGKLRWSIFQDFQKAAGKEMTQFLS